MVTRKEVDPKQLQLGLLRRNYGERRATNVPPLEFIRCSAGYLPQIAGIVDLLDLFQDEVAVYVPIKRRKTVMGRNLWDQKGNRAESMRDSQQSYPSLESAPLPEERVVFPSLG